MKKLCLLVFITQFTYSYSQDTCVYGDTSAAVIAAVQVARMDMQGVPYDDLRIQLKRDMQVIE